MQTANVQELKELLLKTDEEFRQLATQHHNLDERLHELSVKLLSRSICLILKLKTPTKLAFS